MRKASWFNIASVALGLAFLYLPIVILVMLSFNASRLVTVWGGWSTRWYVELWHDRAMLEAAWVTLRLAVLSATAATVLGTLAATALVRYGRFRGRLMFSGMVYAPLVMPEVITGLSLLLLFVAMEQVFHWPQGRGFTTITIAHITLTLAYVTVIVQSRLATLDDSLEEAAMDLGARPLRVFFAITLPLILPAVITAWLLAFMLSLDDFIISNFVSGATVTFPLFVWGTARVAMPPQIYVIGTAVFFVLSLLMLGSFLLERRRSEARAAG
jgi:putrescine transport system permease protein